MRKSTSRGGARSRKPEPEGPIPDDYIAPRWSDLDLRRVLALSTLGVLVFGSAWLVWRSLWLLWPLGFSALALQVSATMIAARSAVGPREPAAPTRAQAPRSHAAVPPESGGLLEALWEWIASLLPPPAEEETPRRERQRAPAPAISIPNGCPPSFDEELHRAFFRRLAEAEFRVFPAGVAWPDLTTVQGSLATRLRLFQRHPVVAPTPTSEITDQERGVHSPWTHLKAIEASEYRRGDTLARFSHRAFAPLAFLELQARLDLEEGENAALEVELLRLYGVGFGRILTPPAVLGLVTPIQHRLGGSDAIALADEARLAIRSTSTVGDAEVVRGEWRAKARTMRDMQGWSGEVLSMAECLIDYWLVQRAAAADMEWAEELARLQGGTLGAAFARRDVDGGFLFAEMLRKVCGGARVADAPAVVDDDQDSSPSATATVA